MSVINLVFTRGIATSCGRYGKRNFRKFELKNKRGSILFKKMQSENPHPDYPIDPRGTRSTGYRDDEGEFVTVPEMIPELVVPNLEDCTLKPYVTYRSEDVYQEEFTALDLFNAVYVKKIKEDFNKNELGPNGEPLNPSSDEKLTAKEARDMASSTGSDLFTMNPKPLGTLFSNEPK